MHQLHFQDFQLEQAFLIQRSVQEFL